MKLSTILDSIDLGSIALPEFQRGFVWNRKQVRDLFYSLYKKHPVGSLLVWETKTENAEARGDGKLSAGVVKLLLDGQQRITSLYGVIRGKAPKFFDGDSRAFTGLYFNLETEEFEFYMPMKMQDNPLWISVTELMQAGFGLMQTITEKITDKEKANLYYSKIGNLLNIKETQFHIDEVTGEDKSVDEVVEIFNRVNSGGTKLSKGDLALAKICAEWPEAREQMKGMLAKWRQSGFYFKLEWLLRCVNALVTGESLFSHLRYVDIEAIKKGLSRSERRINAILNLISGRLGLDHNRVLGSKYAFPILVKYLDDNKGIFNDSKERDKLLFWYIHTLIWGHYSGSTESKLSKDLNLLKQENGLDKLIDELRKNRGSLIVEPRDFISWSKGSRFYPLLYMLTRVQSAKDLETGIELKKSNLGIMNSLEVHHIFPKAQLYKYGYDRAQVNAVANFMFLTKETNLIISNSLPEEYFEKFENKNPGVLQSQWIPMDKELWKTENYLQFLEKRRELLAKASNEFLNSLFSGKIPESEEEVILSENIPGNITDAAEEEEIINCALWMEQNGLPAGEISYELTDEEGNPLAILDLAWPEGIQVGLSKSAALILNEDEQVEKILNHQNYLYFTSVQELKDYVENEILN
jgi:hypothetical protein